MAQRLLLPLLAAAVLAALAACAPEGSSGLAEPAPGEEPGGSERLGDGFVVWESNRDGAWRIWYRSLAGGAPRPLSPREAGLSHCCPHVSPDGSAVAYLARAVPVDRYPPVEVAGPLRLHRLATGEERVLAPAARTYGWGNRAVVWRGPEELVFVDGEGRTRLLQVESGATELLLPEPRPELGWLLNRTLTHATHAAPVFAPYDRAARRVLHRPELGGCEPYFSHDGRYGVFMPAGGGPIRRIDLGTRALATLVPRDDPRLGGQGYLYFPMPSRDGSLLVFGASRGQHDHFTSDYDLFAVATDPRTLEPRGDPVRLTGHPATDRYPDVYATPLALGRHQGEAPLTVRLEGAEGTRWDYGDGTTGEGAAGRHVYRRPGVYTVTAHLRDQVRRGQVIVDPPAPPRVVEVEVSVSGRTLTVHFDEAVETAGTRAVLASGLPVVEQRAGEDGRSLVLRLGRELAGPDRLELGAVRDRAAEPNTLPATTLPVAPVPWPAARDGLVFLWQHGAAANRVADPAGGEEAFSLEPRGRAHLDHHHRMVLGPGSFVVPAVVAERLVTRVKQRFAFSVVATLTPAATRAPDPRPWLTLGPGGGNLALAQEGDRLVARVRAGPQRNPPWIPLAELAPGRPVSLAVTFEPGELTVYRDGLPVVVSTAAQGGLAGWRPGPLVFGGEGTGGWTGTLEGVALYDRVLTAEEVRADAARYRRLLEERRAPARLVVRAWLEQASRVPTLVEISPYREALAVFEYRVLAVREGSYDRQRLRVARWVILDGETLPLPAVGGETTLELTALADNPQLESVYRADTLDPAWDLPLLYAAP